MTSLRLRILGGLLRPLVRSAMRHAREPVRLRRQFNLLARGFRAPPYLLSLPAPDQAPDPAHPELPPGRWVTAGPVRVRPVLLYFHGGGYICGSPATHAPMVARLSRLARVRAYLPAYRLAPEHPAPAAFEDACAAHARLIALGYAPGDIVIGGDSAGGGIALALLAHLCQRGQPPAAAFAFSPFTDVSFSGVSVRQNAKRDHYFPADRVQDLAAMILGTCDARDPRISPLFARFPRCPPVLLQVSESEILRDDFLRMEANLRAQGAAVRLETWADAPHVLQLMDGWVPEAREALVNCATFIGGALASRPARSTNA